MHSPYGLDIIENCLTCKVRENGFFCDLPDELLKMLENLKYATVFPKGAVLFVEGQSPRGTFILCTGRVKLSTCSGDGKAIITQIAEVGEVLGLSATISGQPYEVTAETLSPCQVNFIKREDLLRFLSENGLACLRVAEHLSRNYHNAYEQVRSLGLSHSAGEKLAKLILEWCERSGRDTDRGISLKLTLTHEEMAQLIGSSRETVTRLLGEFKHKQIIYVKGSTLIVRKKNALEAMVSS
ncbi:MAG TPA: Crp/Fnr family transcriptional regulator [Blastocatellia bacterium]|nr:Crp/Fnr family transcriptional regulator [Blastocatellia bacterium]